MSRGREQKRRVKDIMDATGIRYKPALEINQCAMVLGGIRGIPYDTALEIITEVHNSGSSVQDFIDAEREKANG